MSVAKTKDGREYAEYPKLATVPAPQREYLGARLSLEQINFITRREAELGGFVTVPDRAIFEEDGITPVLEFYDGSGVYEQKITITPLRHNEQGQCIGGGDVIREWITPRGEVIPNLPADIQQREKIVKGGQVPFNDRRAAKEEFEALHEIDGGMWVAKETPEAEVN
jgi:hypothetical protein